MRLASDIATITICVVLGPLLLASIALNLRRVRRRR